MQNRHLVIGLGEVGSSLFRVLREHYDVEGIDSKSSVDGAFGVIHACLPYSKRFQTILEDYLKLYADNEALVIIHSTVPLGVTEGIEGAVHSPVRGVHPQLDKGIKEFVKFFGGARAEEAAALFEAIGIETLCTKNPRNTEAMKMWSTTYYGWNIIFQKLVQEYCEEHGLDPNFVYKESNLTYNEGYQELGRGNVVRPVLDHVPGGIGGHCVIPNCRLLESEVSRIILEQNNRFVG